MNLMLQGDSINKLNSIFQPSKDIIKWVFTVFSPTKTYLRFAHLVYRHTSDTLHFSRWVNRFDIGLHLSPQRLFTKNRVTFEMDVQWRHTIVKLLIALENSSWLKIGKSKILDLAGSMRESSNIKSEQCQETQSIHSIEINRGKKTLQYHNHSTLLMAKM